MSKLAAYLYNISLTEFILGSPNYWKDDLKIPAWFAKFYRAISICLNITIPFFIVFELGAFITQEILTNKQESDLLIYGISHPLLFSYSVMLWNQQRQVQDLISQILDMTKVYNDECVEETVLRRSKRDSAALAISCVLSVALHNASALIQVVKSEGTYTTIITTWPLVHDASTAANIVRIISNIIWCMFVSRIVSSYCLVITLTTCMTYLYTNLKSYFYSLSEIFEGNSLTQEQKEREYEEAFKIGVDLHSNTIECFNKFKNICNSVFSCQIIFVISMLVFLMTQMVKSERTFVNASATALTAVAVLISTGFFLWNSGDITLEAAELASAMYFSGWQHCRGDSNHRVRQIVMISMTRSQKPVVLKGLGIMALSYQSYLSLVKTSYSVFSVIY